MILNNTSSDESLFETERIDIANASADYYDEIMDKAGPFYNDLYSSPSLSVDYIGFNCKEPPFDDADIRKAFSLAIDKDKIISLTYRNMAKGRRHIAVRYAGLQYESSWTELDVSQAQETGQRIKIR